MDKKSYVEILLEKRFGKKVPENIPELSEVNTFIPADKEQNPMGMGIQLIVNDSEGNVVKEEYQINPEGIIFSWGTTSVIDERSLKQKI